MVPPQEVSMQSVNIVGKEQQKLKKEGCKCSETIVFVQIFYSNEKYIAHSSGSICKRQYK